MRFAFAFTFVLALGCGSKAAPTKPTAVPLELTFQTFAEAAGGQRGVAIGSTLKTGDRIALSVTVTRPAYIYVLQFFPDGKAGVLFPQQQGEDQAVSGTQRIPSTGWFELDQTTGDEHVYVVASTEPLTQADAAVKKLVDNVRTSGQAPFVPPPPDPRAGEVAPPDPTPDPRPDPTPDPKPDPKSDPTPNPTGTKPRPVTKTAVGAPKRPAVEGLTLATRGLMRVEAGTTIRASADPQGIAVFRFWFGHAPK